MMRSASWKRWETSNRRFTGPQKDALLKGRVFFNPKSAKSPNQEGVRIVKAAGPVAWERL
jgi:hypothetical protein